jgi:hypothetical protein
MSLQLSCSSVGACLPTLSLAPSQSTQEIRRIWVGYWSQADPQLGSRIAAKLQVRGVN